VRLPTPLPLALGTLLIFVGAAFAQGVQITKGPVVEHTSANSAIIAWSTNVSSSTVVKYGTVQNSLTQTAQEPWGSLTHRVTIKHLKPGKTYYFQVDSGQAQGSGTSAMSQIGTFTTQGTSATANGQPQNNTEFRITNGPVLERVGDNTAIVAWSTNLPASSIVKYGTDPNNLSHAAQEAWGQTTHRVELKNLQPGKRYYFLVHSAQGKDSPGQYAEAGPMPFTTAAQGQQAANVQN
jgi:phosphodiesterase/alkaline phosphatase D-like protein